MDKQDTELQQTLSLSKKFTLATYVLHQAAHKTSILQLYLRNEISYAQHRECTYQEHLIFDAIEHAIKNIYGRYKIISDLGDYDYCLADLQDLQHARFLQNPNHSFAIWPETKLMLDRIHKIQNNPAQLLAHIYTLYRALFNGGKIMYGKKMAAAKQPKALQKMPDELCQQYKALDKKLINFINQSPLLASPSQQDAFLREAMTVFELMTTIYKHNFGMSTSQISFWKNLGKTSLLAATVGGTMFYMMNKS